MDFDIGRVYSQVNADELKNGDIVIVADNMRKLRQRVERGKPLNKISSIDKEAYPDRFYIADEDCTGGHNLAYLVRRAQET